MKSTLYPPDVKTEHHATEERIQSAIAATGLGTWEWNLFTHTLRWDDQMFQIFGIPPTPDGLIPFRTWSDSLVPEERAGQIRMLNQFVDGIGQGRRQFHIVRASDQSIRTIQSVDVRCKNLFEQTEWITGTNLDITEKTISDHDLLVSEIRFRRLFEAAHDGVLILDPSTRKITEANPFMVQLLGYDLDILKGKELFEIGLLKDEMASKQMFRELNKDHKVRYENLPLQSQDGQLREVEVVANLYKENEKYVIQCNIRDITARKGAEEILGRSAALMTTLMDEAPLGIFVVDSQFRLQRINTWAMPYFGEVTPLLGRDFAEVVAAIWPPNTAADVILHFRNTLVTGEFYQLPDIAERRIDTHETEVYEWSLRRVLLPTGDFSVVCFVNEITERKQEEIVQRRLAVVTALNRNMKRDIERRKLVEMELTASQKDTSDLLEAATILQLQHQKLTHQFLTVQEEERKRISRELHDVIAQSLTSINWALQIQTDDISTDLREKIKNAQKTVALAVNTVHQFARDLRPSMLDDLGLLSALCTYTRDYEGQTGIKVEIVADKSAELISNDVRTVFYRIVQEALTNVDHHAKATQVNIRIQQDKGNVQLEIEDNGVGFSPEDPRTSGQLNRLGLLGMRERVEMIGGNFNIVSQPGGPTTVRVEAPF